MNKELDILPKDEEGEYHGCVEEYHDNGKLSWKGVYVNGELYGYCGSYFDDGIIDAGYCGYWMCDYKISYDNKEGSCFIWNRVEL